MDAVIRFCFSVDPEEIEDENKYAKLYGQAKWILDYQNLMITAKAVTA